jgi:hypothetical protein
LNLAILATRRAVHQLVLAAARSSKAGLDLDIAIQASSDRLRARHAAHGRTHGGNRNDITQVLPLVDAIPPVRGRRGRPERLYGDRAYHSREGRRELRRRRIQARIAAPKTPHVSGLGKQRRVVERTIAWLHRYRGLRVRYERRADIHEPFLAIGCRLICLRLLRPENLW